jgi:hypothetical protein
VNNEEALKILLADRRLMIESLMTIEDKYRQIVPFRLNPIQAAIQTESTGRDVIIKPAQAGGTSIIVANFLLDCLTKVGTTSVIISYDEFITGRLLRKAEQYYNNLINNTLGLRFPKYHHKSVYEKTFVFETSQGKKLGESSLYIASAKGFSMPRGEPIHNLLWDELGFWPPGAAADAFAASLQRVPLLPDTRVIALSTPNGENNDFYEIYKAAKEGKEVGKSIFTAHFYPWYMLPEYEMKVDSTFTRFGDDQHILIDLNEDEQALFKRFISLGIDETEANDKLRWRRYKIETTRGSTGVVAP